jgi:hypothetical protein
VPDPGGYDGDGITDFAIYRPADGVLYVVYSSSGREFQQWLGDGATFTGTTGDGLTPAKEYIYFGGKLLAVENR